MIPFYDISEKRLQQIMFYSTIIIVGAVVFFSFLTLQPANWVKFVQPYHVISPFVNQGGGMNYEVEYCSKKELFLVVNRQLENIQTGELWDVPDRAAHISKGCSKEQHNVPIPVKIEAGTYKLQASISIKVNPLRTDTYNFESESFQIGNY